jgi:intracellular multiplication protein IcmG
MSGDDKIEDQLDEPVLEDLEDDFGEDFGEEGDFGDDFGEDLGEEGDFGEDQDWEGYDEEFADAGDGFDQPAKKKSSNTLILVGGVVLAVAVAGWKLMSAPTAYVAPIDENVTADAPQDQQQADQTELAQVNQDGGSGEPAIPALTPMPDLPQPVIDTEDMPQPLALANIGADSDPVDQEPVSDFNAMDSMPAEELQTPLMPLDMPLDMPDEAQGGPDAGLMPPADSADLNTDMQADPFGFDSDQPSDSDLGLDMPEGLGDEPELVQDDAEITPESLYNMDSEFEMATPSDNEVSEPVQMDNFSAGAGNSGTVPAGQLNEILDRLVAIEDGLSEIQSLSDSVSDIERRLGKLERQPRATSSSRPKTSPKKNTETYSSSSSETDARGTSSKSLTKWVLKSAQPGRAIVSKVGESEIYTIHVGESLAGIGKITSISVEDGKWVVQATNGKILQ